MPRLRAKTGLLGPDARLRTLHPKLRMIANGDITVNTVRAEHTAAVKVSKSQETLDKIPRLRSAAASVFTKESFRQAFKKKLAKPKYLKTLPRQVLANVFLHTTTPQPLPDTLVAESARHGRIAKATIAISDLPRLAKDERIRFIELGEPLRAPQPSVSKAPVDTPPATRAKVEPFSRHRGGKEVLIGIVDVQGFDFSHPDFLDDDGHTRFVAIWDQGGDARRPPKGDQFNYGSEFIAADLNAALRGARQAKVPAYELERQSQREPGAHGTHVASIAAGRRGVCPNAKIAAVLLDLPREDLDRRRSFYDSTRLADAIDYLVQLAGDKPISINVSLGTNGHAHDTSSAINRWIDAVVNEPGRCVTVAAGNSGQSRVDTQDPNDFGWLLGQIHTSGQIPKAGLNVELEWVVVGNVWSTCRRTSSSSGTARRTDSPSSCGRPAWTGWKRSRPVNTSRTGSCPMAASSASTTSSTTRRTGPTTSPSI